MNNKNLGITSRLASAVALATIVGFGAAIGNAATYTVDTTTDDASLSACTSAGNDCSLRGAIANANASIDDDTIDFDASLAGQTITLGGTELSIDNNGGLTINGLGADRLSISGGGASRVFFIQKDANVTISSITVTGGVTKSLGGGIYLEGGTLTLSNSAVSGNNAKEAGGGIMSTGTLILNDSTIRENKGGFGAGGIFDGGDTQINRSTISGNTAERGGGIVSGGKMTLNNSTVSGNIATSGPAANEVPVKGRIFGGGGILNNEGTLTLNSSTVSNNKSVLEGAGIYNGNGTVNIGNTIVAANSGLGEDDVPDLTGDFKSNGFNLIGEGGNGFGDNDLTRVAPRLEELKDNGGPTATHALQCGSPAIDTGKNLEEGVRWDQRGIGFLRSLDDPGTVDKGDTTDIGAVEMQSPCGGYYFGDTDVKYSKQFVVDNDGDDGSLSACTDASNDCSLRGAISSAKNTLGVDKITFDASLSGQTITLAGEDLEIDDFGSVVIEGPGENDLTISGDNKSRVFDIGTFSRVVIKGLTITGGNAGDGTSSNRLGSGGAVYNYGTLLLSEVTISGNTAIRKGLGGDGGGIANHKRMTLVNSTVSGNKSDGAGGIDNGWEGTLTVYMSKITGNEGGSGGGIDNYGGTVLISDSTIGDNIANGDGGGIHNWHLNDKTSRGVMLIYNSTISGNTAKKTGLFGAGGGIHNMGTVIAANTTISGNTATKGGGIDNSIDTVVLNNSTVTNNTSQAAGFFGRIASFLGAGGGGGIFNRSDGTVSLGNTIVAGNTAEDKKNPDVFGEFSSKGFNLIGDIAKATGFGPADIFGGDGRPALDPMLGELADNGGWTKTHALLCGSPAIDAGKNFFARSELDQRQHYSTKRTFDQTTVANKGEGTDIGAFEMQQEQASKCN